MGETALTLLGSLGERVQSSKPDELPKMRLTFLRAGFRNRKAPAVFWGVKVMLTILFPLCFFVLRLTTFKLVSPTLTFAMCTFLAVGGFYLPEIWLRQRIANRKEMIFLGLPDLLDLLVICVEAGMGLDAAFSRVAEEMRLSNRVLSDEFRLLNLELRAGKLRRDALRDLALRVDLEDLRSLVTVLIQTERFGTSIADALRVFSDSLRTKRFQRAEETAAKLPVKLMFPLIFFIFPALFVAILGPAAINIARILFQAMGQNG
jgi:tight adherence protein C